MNNIQVQVTAVINWKAAERLCSILDLHICDSPKKHILLFIFIHTSTRGLSRFHVLYSQPHPPPFLIIPPLLFVVTATIKAQRSKQNDLTTICNKTEQNVLFFQSLTFEHLGSIYLLNIIVLRNVEEAEKIGGLVSVTVIQFPFWFPSVK